MRFVGPVRFIFKGDLDRARSHLGEARKLIGTMDAINPSRYASLPERLPDGTFMKAINNAGQRMVIIDAPESPVVQPSVRNYYLARVTGGEAGDKNLWVSRVPDWDVNLTADVALPSNFIFGGVCAFSPDGKYLVVGGWITDISEPITYVLEFGTWAILKIITGPGGFLSHTSATFSPDSQYMLLSGLEGGIFETSGWTKVAHPWSSNGDEPRGLEWLYDFNAKKNYIVTGWEDDERALIGYNVPEWTEAWSRSYPFDSIQPHIRSFYDAQGRGVFDFFITGERTAGPSPRLRLNTPAGIPSFFSFDMSDYFVSIETTAQSPYGAGSLASNVCYIAVVGFPANDKTETMLLLTSGGDIITSAEMPVLGNDLLIFDAWVAIRADWSPDGRYIALGYIAPTGDPGGHGFVHIVDIVDQVVIEGPPMGADPWVQEAQVISFSPFITS